MKFRDALKKLEEAAKKKKLGVEKIVVCSRLGTRDSKIVYGTFNELEDKEISAPFCFIIPGKLHFMEKEVLESFNR
jgi:diphthamide biosynthesis methyltransferase